MAVAGATVALASGWGMVKTFRAGWFIARGGRRLQRSTHPVAFWLNAAGALVALLLGLGLMIGAAVMRNARPQIGMELNAEGRLSLGPDTAGQPPWPPANGKANRDNCSNRRPYYSN